MTKLPIQILGAITLLFDLTGCAEPIVMVGEAQDAIDPTEVRLYYTQRPQCEFETVGYLEVNSGHYSRASLFTKMQEQAAEVGADGVYVIEVRRLNMSEHIGTARAIRCLHG
jgi:hypothetical protein